MPSLRSQAVVVLGAATLGAAVPKSFPIAFPQPGLSVLNTGTNGGLNGLPHPAWEASQRPWGTLPQVCHTAATENNYCNVYDVEVYELRTTDCPQPWIVCRCNNSPFPRENLFQKISQVPVQARQYVRFWQNYPGGGGAFSLASDITLFGDYSDGMTVFLHETSHNLDYWVAGGQGGGSFSTSSVWDAIINSDSCAADDYGKTTNTEEYAQIGVLSAYHTNVADIFSEHDVGCLRDQFDVVHGQLTATWKYDANQHCTVRLNEHDSPDVCMGPEAERKGACANLSAKRGLERRYPGIGVLDVPRSTGPSEAEEFDIIAADLLLGRKKRFAA